MNIEDFSSLENSPIRRVILLSFYSIPFFIRFRQRIRSFWWIFTRSTVQHIHDDYVNTLLQVCNASTCHCVLNSKHCKYNHIFPVFFQTDSFTRGKYVWFTCSSFPIDIFADFIITCKSRINQNARICLKYLVNLIAYIFAQCAPIALRFHIFLTWNYAAYFFPHFFFFILYF